MLKTKKMLISFILIICSIFVYADIEIYFAPEGGFSEKNNKRTITLDGKEVVADLNNTLLELIKSTEEGGTIKIAMYAFGYRPIQDALIEAARDRKIKVKLILDAIASWTTDIRVEFKNKILEETKKAKEEGRIFDFQLKEIYPQAMVDRGRFTQITDGSFIYGTMHEKFGIVLPKGSNIPLHGFCGSANISWSASQVFAENRVIFKNEPIICRQLAEDFARIWNEYGTNVTSNCQSEKFIPTTVSMADVQILSNAKPVDEDNYLRLDQSLMKLMNSVNRRGGTIEVAIFSFTHIGLANELLDVAERCPKVKVRILMDQTQLVEDVEHRGILGPYMEKVVELKGLKNFEVRYKWRSNTYGWNPETNRAELIHWKNLLLHHKCLVVDRKLMGLGSYNWSSSAEFRNFENIMIFNGDIPKHKEVIDRFMAEFDIMWNSLKPEGTITEKLANPQVITGPRGRSLKKAIVSNLNNEICKKIMEALDYNKAGCTIEEIANILNIEDINLLKEQLAKLIESTLIFEKDKIYQLAD